MAQDAFKVEAMPDVHALFNAQYEIGARIFLAGFMAPWELVLVSWGISIAPPSVGGAAETNTDVSEDITQTK